jgi:acyl-CoA reductase-like NAD-dependent aldehyde dehydrogenase
MLDFGMMIGGRKIAAQETFSVFNPATGELVAKAPNASLADLDDAVTAAQDAFPSWSRMSDVERQAACAALAGKLAEYAEEIARLLTLEQGKPMGALGSRWELGGAQAWAGFTASLSMPVKVLQDDNTGRVELHRKPIGVVGSITPWNFPVMIAIWHVLPALRAGNTVVIKPSPYTPLSTLRTVELLNQILPQGVLNIVTSDDKLANIGGAMAAHDGIRKIVFTGSLPRGYSGAPSSTTVRPALR